MRRHAPFATRVLRRAGIAMVVIGLLIGAIGALVSIGVLRMSDEAIVFAIMLPVVLVLGGTLTILNAGPIEKDRVVGFSFGATAFTLWVMVGWLWLIVFGTFERHPGLTKLLSGMSAVAIASGIVIQLLAAEVRTPLLRRAFVVLACWIAIYAAWSLVLIWFQTLQALGEILGPMTAVLGVITVVLLIGARVVVAWKRQPVRSETLDAKPKLRMTCPKCQIERVHATGPAKCPGCRVFMIIDIQEPRCECGYALYRLQADQCPECGRAIAM